MHSLHACVLLPALAMILNGEWVTGCLWLCAFVEVVKYSKQDRYFTLKFLSVISKIESN